MLNLFCKVIEKSAALLIALFLAVSCAAVTVSAEVIIDPSDDDLALYKLSYASLTERVQKNGYAATSLTGKYKGMYVRDAAIQVMAMTANGDLEMSKAVLEYIFDYHEATGYGYALCILPEVADMKAKEIEKPVSTRIQSDATYMLLHALAKWYEAAPDGQEKQLFLERHWGIICAFADYFTTDKYYSAKLNLILNPSFQQITRYFKCYDLITNVFASQAFFELSQLARDKGDGQYADKWYNAAMNLKSGIENKLTDKSQGVRIYREMYDAQMRTYYLGFSFINLAPVAAEWFGTDEEIMRNTYDQYMKRAANPFDNVLLMDSRHIVGTARWSEEILGKHLAWEIMYLAGQKENSVRLRELLNFITSHTPQGNPYAEAWVFNGRVQDTGNQEQTAWLVYAMATRIPKMSGYAVTVSSEPESSPEPESQLPVSSAAAQVGQSGSDKVLDVLFVFVVSMLAVSIAVLLVQKHRKKNGGEQPESKDETE